jgi:PAS domain S-box-containing protein
LEVERSERKDEASHVGDPALVEAARIEENALGIANALLSTSGDCIKILDLEGRVLFVNQGGVAALELGAAADIVGGSWFALWTGGGRQAAQEGVGSACQGKIFRFTGEASTAKGSPRSWDVTVSPIFDASSKVVQILVQSRDVSGSRRSERTIAELVLDARASEAELRASEAKFQTIADTMPQMVWSTRPDGFHDYYNARWYEFTGVPAGSTDGEAWNGMFHPEDQERAFARWRRSLETGEPYEIEYRLRHRSGEYRWTLGRALPIRDETGAITRWFGTCTDIHATKQDAEMLSLLSQELSHRIKNIFAIVQGLIGLSARKQPEFRAFAETLRERIAALGRAHDFARPHSEESRPVVERTTLHALIREILKPYPAMQDDRIAIEGMDMPVDDKAATPIALMIHELATNAMKYGALSAPGGRIRITTFDNESELNLSWIEQGGPAIAEAPSREGFGTQLSTMSVTNHLGGSIERQWLADGLVVSIRCAIAALNRDP